MIDQKETLLTILFWIVDFGTFILTDKLFAKNLRNLDSCGSVNNNLCGKLL